MTGNLFDKSSSVPAAGDWFMAHCDGGSRGNPGPAAYGVVITNSDGRDVARLSKFLGRQTNNYAEYSGLLAALQWAVENGAKALRVVSDSELMVKQINGQYKVANPVLRPLWEEAMQLSRKLAGFEIRHTLREGNREADRLANEAMDEGMGRRSVQGPASSVQRTASREQSPGGGKHPKRILDGYVKGGVVHLLDGELPDGVFVKVIQE